MARIPTTSPDTPAPSREDEVLIREIDEAVREDALYDFMRNHGVKVLGGVLALIAAMGGYMIWHHFSEQALETQSETVISALDLAEKNDLKSASEKVAGLLGDDSSPGARAAARFIQAAAALEAGDKAKASGLYKQIAADATTPPALKDLARVREVSINYDTMKPAAVIAQLKDLATPGNPFFGSAGELVAMAHLEAGNRAEAGKLFSEISKDEDLPESLRSRARQMAGLMGVDAIVDVKKLLKDQGVTSDEQGASAAAPATPPAQ
ncbi:tetratricopeptide repeat protein [Erythrobacter oryzae]|uniref:tetratricopeptide repeat protein n=1 Tax=Erythrobacter oryzae TaxID=3019556 RepID=UPI002557B761|nr:tetratricopeptide repeat protein [Erythrobacter sp. COR-2]